MPNKRFLFAAIVAAGCGGGSIAEDTDVDSSNSALDAETDRGSVRRCYTVESLGTLGGANSAASAINERGEVIGTSDTETGEEHAFLWSCGELRDLGTLGGATSVPKAINDHGVVVGSSMLADGSTHAFVWRNGFMHDLGTLPGKPNSSAESVNNRGQIVGNAGTSDAFIWEHGRMRRLPGLFDLSVAQANFITESGRIFGLSNGFDQDFYSVVEWHHDRVKLLLQHAFIYGASNAGVVGDPPFIWVDGQLFRTSFTTWRINDRGQVVGSGGIEQHGILWDHGVETDLGPGGASLINNRTEIVLGNSVWFRGVVTPLPRPCDAATCFLRYTGINDAGEIVGVATRNAGSESPREAVLWRPSRCHHH